MARIILLNGPPVNTHFKKNLHAFKNLAARPWFCVAQRHVAGFLLPVAPAIGALEVGFL